MSSYSQIYSVTVKSALRSKNRVSLLVIPLTGLNFSGEIAYFPEFWETLFYCPHFGKNVIHFHIFWEII